MLAPFKCLSRSWNAQEVVIGPHFPLPAGASPCGLAMRHAGTPDHSTGAGANLALCMWSTRASEPWLPRTRYIHASSWASFPASVAPLPPFYELACAISCAPASVRLDTSHRSSTWAAGRALRTSHSISSLPCCHRSRMGPAWACAKPGSGRARTRARLGNTALECQWHVITIINWK